MEESKGRQAYIAFLDFCGLFLICGFLGFVYEEVLECVIMGVPWYKRGFLAGPILPIYGFGGAFLNLFFGKMKARKLMVSKVNLMPAVLFVVITVLATLGELMTSYLLGWFQGYFLWNYAMYYKIQWQGRIALVPSLLFGILGIAALYLLIPFILKFLHKTNFKVRQVLLLGLCAVTLVDFVLRLC